jgi:hypothetical protein
MEEDRAEAAAIDATAIQATALTLFAPGNLNLVAVGPWRADAKRQVEKLVRSYARDYPAAL